MNALLLYPKCMDSFRDYQHALKIAGKKACMPPLGLLTVAGLLPESWQKRLVDVNVRELTEDDLAWADIVFISAVVTQGMMAEKLVGRCKAAGKTVVAGGPLFRAKQECFPTVNHFVLSEAEAVLPEFLRDFENGCAQRVYKATEFPDIVNSPMPMWELLDLKHYAYMCVQYSRGCPFDCDYCYITTLFGHVFRTKTGEQLVSELEALYRLGWRGEVLFVDDNLAGNRERVKQDLLPKLIKWKEGKPRIPFSTQISINLADDEEFIRLMVAAGFEMVFIGIETPDETCLEECNKKVNRNRDLLEDVRRIHRAGIRVESGVIVGFDSDTPSIFQRQIEFIEKSNIVVAMVNILQVIPETKLYKRLEREGRLEETPLDYHLLDGITNFVPKMNLDILRGGYGDIVRQLFSPEPYYRRIRAFLREFKPARTMLTVNWQNLLALVRACVFLGVLGRERFHFWGLILWTLVNCPSHMELAFRLAIYGYDFRQTLEPVWLSIDAAINGPSQKKPPRR